jgi:hypothetical protein
MGCAIVQAWKAWEESLVCDVVQGIVIGGVVSGCVREGKEWEMGWRCDEGYREFYIPLKKKTDRYEEKEEKKKGAASKRTEKHHQRTLPNKMKQKSIVRSHSAYLRYLP